MQQTHPAAGRSDSSTNLQKLLRALPTMFKVRTKRVQPLTMHLTLSYVAMSGHADSSQAMSIIFLERSSHHLRWYEPPQMNTLSSRDGKEMSTKVNRCSHLDEHSISQEMSKDITAACQ
jgi:hypothetical protein